MKIAFVFPPMWTPHSDGSLQIWNREATTRLAKNNDVLVYSRETGTASTQPDDCIDGVRFRYFSTRWDRRFLKRFRFLHKILGIRRPLYSTDVWYPLYAWKVALDLRKQGCDVVHVYMYPQFANLIKRLNPGVKVILNMHGESLARADYTNLRMRLRNIDMVLACSNFMTEDIRAKFPQIVSRCKAVPMGLSPDAYSRPYQDPNPHHAPPRRLLAVARIAPEKGIHVLLDAFESIVRQYPDATLTILGAEWIAARDEIVDLCLEKDVIASLEPFYVGSYLSQLKQRLSPEAAKQVTFTGFVAYRDVPAYYTHSDIYVTASLHESFGMSVIEAMAAGLPVVASRIRSFEDLISNEHNGLLVPTLDPSALANTIIKLFKDDSLRKSISCAGREAVCQQYSWDMISSLLMQRYLDALDKKAAPAGYAEGMRVDSNASTQHGNP